MATDLLLVNRPGEAPTKKARAQSAIKSGANAGRESLVEPMRARLARSLAPFAVLLGLLAAPAFAQEKALELDPTQSAVHFTLKSSLHTVHGTFTLTSGKVSFDPATGKAAGSIIVSAASGESGNKGRDSKMHKEIIESQRYPEITFALHDIEGRVEMQGDSHVEVKGELRLLGQDHEIVIPVTLRSEGSAVTLDSDFSIPYIAWGLKNPSTFILRASDMVEVNVHASGNWTAADTH
jgi:polyisoprenoid-binding protein YceI